MKSIPAADGTAWSSAGLRRLIRLGLWVGALGNGLFLLSLGGALRPQWVLALGTAAALGFLSAELFLWHGAGSRGGGSVALRWNHWPACLVVVALLAILALQALLAALPEVGRDALIQHLAFPKRFVESGRFLYVGEAPYAYYPMAGDFLYVFPLSMERADAAALVHLAFGWLTAGAIYLYVARRWGRGAAVFGALLFLTTPIVFFLSGVSYVDLTAAFFVTLSWIALSLWREEGCPIRWLCAAAALVGLAASVKYFGYIAMYLTGLGVVAMRLRSARRAFAEGTLFFVLALAVCSPWWIQNLHETGNPVHPYLSGIFGGPHDGGAQEPMSGLGLRMLIYGESAIDLLLLPFRVFFSGEDGNPRLFDGRLSPVYLLLLGFGLVEHRARRERWLALLAIGFVVLVLALAPARARYLVIALPVLAVFASVGGLWLWSRPRLRLAAVAAGFVMLAWHGSYALERVERSGAWDYYVGGFDREAYLESRLAAYPVWRYGNEWLPEDARIYHLLTGNRIFYSNRAAVVEPDFHGGKFVKGVKSGGDFLLLRRFLCGQGVSHVLMNEQLLYKRLHAGSGGGDWEMYGAFRERHLSLEHRSGNYAIYGVHAGCPRQAEAAEPGTSKL